MTYYFGVLSKYVAFDGRARRAEFWYFQLINTIISIALGALGGALGFKLLGNLYALAVFLPSLGVGIRRMHDVGRSGWHVLIPIYNIILACEAGYPGSNLYGPDPKAIG